MASEEMFSKAFKMSQHRGLIEIYIAMTLAVYDQLIQCQHGKTVQMIFTL